MVREYSLTMPPPNSPPVSTRDARVCAADPDQAKGSYMDPLADDRVRQAETRATSAGRTSTGRPKVLIIGGGFGGLFCARRLGRVDVDVTLLDRAACHVFQPLLYQCA